MRCYVPARWRDFPGNPAGAARRIALGDADLEVIKMRATPVTASVLAGLFLAGCASSGNDQPASAPSDAAATPPVTLSGMVNNHGATDVSSQGMTASLSLEQDDFYFGPTFVRATAGQVVKVKLENEGDKPHTFTIDALGVDQEVAPGKSAQVSVTVPAGSAPVVFYCRFHRGGGMQGAFYVGNAGGGAPPASSAPEGNEPSY
ncbi:MAG: cupredoxin domain-containing protein [Mycobacteriales bacterium]|nr:cupredoxin domain-containing protein [Frankia sp.]